MLSREMSDVPINILLRADRLSNSALAICTHMRAKGKLDKNTTDSLILVQFLDNVYNVVDLSLLGNLDVLERDADFLCRLRLHAHVHDRVRTCASLDDSKLGLEVGVLGLQGLNPARDLAANRSEGSRP